jgi:hypothetical protein
MKAMEENQTHLTEQIVRLNSVVQSFTLLQGAPNGDAPANVPPNVQTDAKREKQQVRIG